MDEQEIIKQGQQALEKKRQALRDRTPPEPQVPAMVPVAPVVLRSLDEVRPAAGSPRPQESTTGSNPCEFTEMVESYLRHWGISDDAINGRKTYVDDARQDSALMEKIGKGIYAHGPQGRGKTSYATALLAFEIERFLKRESPYHSIQFMFVPDLILELQSCFAPGSDKSAGDVIYRVAEYDFLVLDDLGEGKPTEFVVQSLDTLIHHRDAARKTKRTVITANYTPQGLAERLDARIASRVASMCHVIPFTGRDWRMPQS